MAARKSDPARKSAKSGDTTASPLARVMREYDELVLAFETGLLRSLDDAQRELRRRRRDDLRHHACRLALAELSTQYTRKQILCSLRAAETLGKSVEERLHSALDASVPPATDLGALDSLHNGYFRLYSTALFDLLGRPTNLRFGTLRFLPTSPPHSDWTSLELALSSSFFVANALETLPYHIFHVPPSPSLQNRGILSRKPEDNGAFPPYDSWLLFTFLGHGCLKVEIPIEMCADVYGGPLRGRENVEVLFWGIFVPDDAVDDPLS
ncbi:hypothetical protein K505DRAFT_241781 [Melanomma pulvis-pyrius CBS 109.77]|uniref:Uncharacterized protein n=1 Tax=Melanomma pulvis-pyrius CBS 109.77 TaxID=1314802 RepID=A0A6A6XDT8_9PLEO|nr:hypothetical protein K505DRAFT_241781 [Melanomma pulvis-pyrius CBS 109.77]